MYMAGGKVAEVQLIFQGVDQVSDVAKQIARSLEDVNKAAENGGEGTSALNEAIGQFAKVAAVAVGAATALAAAVGACVMSAAANEVQMVRLEAAVQASGQSWEKVGGTVTQFVEDSLMPMARSFEDVSGGLGLMTLMTGDYEKAMALLPIAANVAAGRQLDLSTAIKLVGFAAQGNYSLLKRYNITISETATPMEALMAIQKAYAGQTEAFANTFQGAMNRVGIAIDRVQEAVGGVFLSTMTGALNSAATAITGFIPTAVQMATSLMAVFQQIAASVNAALPTINSVIAATGAVIKILASDIVGVLAQAFATLGGIVASAAGFFTGTLLPAVASVAGFISSNFVPILAGLATSLILVAATIYGPVVAAITTMVNALIVAGTVVVSQAAIAIASTLATIAPYVLVGAAVALLVKMVIDNWEAIKQSTANLVEVMTTLFEGYKEYIANSFIGKIFEWLRDAFGKLLGWVGELMQMCGFDVSKIAEDFNKLPGVVRENIAKIGEKVAGFGKTVWETGRVVIGSVGDQIAEWQRYYNTISVVASAAAATANNMGVAGAGASNRPGTTPPATAAAPLPIDWSRFDFGTGAATAAVKEKAGEVTKDIASLIKDLLTDIQGILEVLGTEFPDLKTPLTKWLDKLIEISQIVADYMSRPGMAEMAQNLKDKIKPILDNWKAGIESLGTILKTVQTVVETEAITIGEVKTSVTKWLDKLFSVTQEVGGWINKNAATLPQMVEWFKKDLAPILTNWAEGIKPLSDLLSTIKSVSDVTAEPLKGVEASIGQLFDRMVEVMNAVKSRMNETKTWQSYIDDFKKRFTPILTSWAEAIKPLGDLFSTIKNVLDVTSEKAKPVLLSVDTFFDNIRDVVNEVTSYVGGPDGNKINSMLLAWGKAGDAASIAGMIAAWAEKLKPLGELFTVIQGILDSTAVAVAGVKMSVSAFFNNLLEVVNQVSDYIWGGEGNKLDSMITAWGGTGADDKSSINAIIGRWVKAIEPLGALFTAVQGVLDSTAAPVGKVKLSIQTFFDNVKKIMSAVADYVKDDWKALRPGNISLASLMNTFDPEGPLGTTIATWNKNLGPLGTLLSTGSSILDTASKPTAMVQMSIENFFTNLKSIMEAVTGWVGRSGKDFEDYLIEFAATTGVTLAAWNEGLKPLSDLLSTGASIVQTLSGEFLQATVDVGVLLNNMLAYEYGVAGWIATQDAKFGEGGFAAEAERLVGIIEAPIAAMQTALGPIKELLSTAEELSKIKVADITSVMSTVVIPALTAMINGLSDVAALMEKNPDTSGSLINANAWGVAIGVNIANGLTAQNGPVLLAAQTLVGQVALALNAMSQPLYTGGYNIGVDVGQGIVDGLNSQLGQVAAAAGNLAAASISGVEAPLDIASPSKVMEQLGAQAGAGFWQGLANSNGGGLPGGATPGGLAQGMGSITLHVLLEGAANGAQDVTIDLNRAEMSAKELYVRAALKGGV
jgi:hypothetical protein